MSESSSVLLGLDGLVVDHAQYGADGGRDVRVLTAPQWRGLCPGCGVRSTRSKAWVMTRPGDVKVGPDVPNLLWCKQKWACRNTECARRFFTESVPQVPPRARFTDRARAEMAAAVLDDNRTVSEVARSYRTSWNTCHDAVAATADPVLAVEPGPVAVLGVDETRRGRAGWQLDPLTAQRMWVDRFDTGLVDITGSQGLLGQVNGRDAAAVVAWLDARGEEFKKAITHVTIDMSAAYAAAVGQALPHALLVVDRFHVVKKANEMIDEVRRRITQQQRGRRGRSTDPEWISRRRLLRGAERLTVEQRAVLWRKLTTGSFDADRDIAAAWIAKELLRDVLACKDNGGLRWEIRAALDAFYTFAAATKVPEIHTLAATIDRWQQPIITAIRTGLSNAASEGHNRIVKHVGRVAFGFRNPTNQRRRIRWACTRRTRPAPPRAKQPRPC
jgi:transposase